MKGKVRRLDDRRGKEMMGDEMRGAGNALIITHCFDLPIIDF